MWTEIINLLKVQFSSDEEEAQFDSDLLDLNDWIKREYGPSGLTCEELCLAYNALVKEELTKEGRLLEAYPKLDARHVGEVIAAYRRATAGDETVKQVLTKGLYLPAPAEQTPEDIDARMEKNLQEAIRVTKLGVQYFDLGNGLYTWLYKQGRIRPTDEQWEAGLVVAQCRVRENLAQQKSVAGQFEGYESMREVIGKRLGAVMNQEGDFTKRVRTEAFRILLENWLIRKAGVSVPLTAYLPTTPSLKPPEPDTFKPFSHSHYIDSLKKQLPTMSDEAVSDLQGRARKMNVLDVYELATAEWEVRTAKKPLKPAKHK